MSDIYHKGNIIILSDGVPVREMDTYMCKHCNKIIVVNHIESAGVHSASDELWDGNTNDPERKKKRRGFCFRCMGPTCGEGECMRCIPFEAKMEAMEGTRRFWRQMDIVTGHSY